MRPTTMFVPPLFPSTAELGNYNHLALMLHCYISRVNAFVFCSLVGGTSLCVLQVVFTCLRVWTVLALRFRRNERIVVNAFACEADPESSPASRLLVRDGDRAAFALLRPRRLRGAVTTDGSLSLECAAGWTVSSVCVSAASA